MTHRLPLVLALFAVVACQKSTPEKNAGVPRRGSELGAECDDADECASGVCKGDRCVTCQADADCLTPTGLDAACVTNACTDGACTYVVHANRVCAEAACDGDSLGLARTCDDGGQCRAPEHAACAPYACGDAQCRTACTTTDDCADGYSCTNGVCGACDDVSDCPLPSGADAACVERACVAGACEVTIRTGDVCAAAECNGDAAVPARSCNGTGVCAQALGAPCAPYACGPSATCGTTCNAPEDCALGYTCDGSHTCILSGSPSTLIDFVQLPGGTFSMGEDGTGGDELPAHQVTVSGFYLAKTEVSCEQWHSVRDWAVLHGYTFDDGETCGYNPFGDANKNPVVNVLWFDALKWLNALSEKEGKTPAYYTTGAKTTVYRTGQVEPDLSAVTWDAGYRLPTEAEWEYAARGGAHTVYYFGDALDPAYEWYDPNAGGGTHPVGQKLPNAFGLFDMLGNAHEWAWDLWPSAYGAGAQTNPTGATSGGWARVNRGGSFLNGVTDYTRLAFRRGVTPGVQNDFDGTLRVALHAP